MLFICRRTTLISPQAKTFGDSFPWDLLPRLCCSLLCCSLLVRMSVYDLWPCVTLVMSFTYLLIIVTFIMSLMSQPRLFIFSLLPTFATSDMPPVLLARIWRPVVLFVPPPNVVWLDAYCFCPVRLWVRASVCAYRNIVNTILQSIWHIFTKLTSACIMGHMWTHHSLGSKVKVTVE